MMKENIVIKFGTDKLDWEKVLNLIEGVSSEKEKTEKYFKACERVSKAFQNSYLVCSATEEGKLVGICRSLSDGVRQSVIYDLNVSRPYRNQGIGTKLIETIISKLPDGPIILYAMPGKEKYYQKFGFRSLITGMAKFPDADSRKIKGFIK